MHIMAITNTEGNYNSGLMPLEVHHIVAHYADADFAASDLEPQNP